MITHLTACCRNKQPLRRRGTKCRRARVSTGVGDGGGFIGVGEVRELERGSWSEAAGVRVVE